MDFVGDEGSALVEKIFHYKCKNYSIIFLREVAPVALLLLWENVFKINFSYKIKASMDTTRYKRFCQQLDLEKFNSNLDEACLFYFRLLQELEVEVASTKAQVQNLRTIIGSQAKTTQLSGKSYSPGGYLDEAERRQHMQASESKEEEGQQYRCDFRGCEEVYERGSRLVHHKMLKHKEPPTDLNQNRVFRVQIRDSTNENRRPTRF